MEIKQKGYTIEDEERVTCAVGGAYTHKEVGNTVVDPTLCKAIVSEILKMPEFRADNKNIILRLQEDKNRNLLGAIYVLLNRRHRKGDEIGFEIKRTHYTIVKD